MWVLREDYRPRKTRPGTAFVLALGIVVILAFCTSTRALRSERPRTASLLGKGRRTQAWERGSPASAGTLVGPRPTPTAVPAAVHLPAGYSQTFAGWDDFGSHPSHPPTRRVLIRNVRQNASSSASEASAAEVNGPQSELLSALLADYDKTVQPQPEAGGPVVVEVNVALHKIIKVDLQEGSMELNAWLRLHWRDPRLAWNATEWGVDRLFVTNQELRYMDIWYPDVTLWNSAYDVATTLGAQAPILRPGGDVFWGRNGLLRVACNFRGLAAFPFGAVRCLLEFGTWSHGPLTAVVREAPQGGATIAGNSVTDMAGAKAVEWKFSGVRSWIHHYPAYPCCPDESRWPVVLVELELHRTQTLFALKILVPQVVLALVGFMTFWLSPECGERLGVAVTIPLALAVYDLLVYSTLPASDDISCIGAIGLLGFLFSVVTLAINGAVIQLYHYREPRWWMGSGTIWAIWLRFRQQQVWGLLLEVLDKLETELIKQHLKDSQAAKKERQAAKPPRQRRLSFMCDRRTGGGGGGGGGRGEEAAAVQRSRAREADLAAGSGGAPGAERDSRRAELGGGGSGRRTASVTGAKSRRLSRLLLVPQPSQERERLSSPARLPSVTSPPPPRQQSQQLYDRPAEVTPSAMRSSGMAVAAAAALRGTSHRSWKTASELPLLQLDPGPDNDDGGGAASGCAIDRGVSDGVDAASPAAAAERVRDGGADAGRCDNFDGGGAAAVASIWAASPAGSARYASYMYDTKGPGGRPLSSASAFRSGGDGGDGAAAVAEDGMSWKMTSSLSSAAAAVVVPPGGEEATLSPAAAAAAAAAAVTVDTDGEKTAAAAARRPLPLPMPAAMVRDVVARTARPPAEAVAEAEAESPPPLSFLNPTFSVESSFSGAAAPSPSSPPPLGGPAGGGGAAVWEGGASRVSPAAPSRSPRVRAAVGPAGRRRGSGAAAASDTSTGLTSTSMPLSPSGPRAARHRQSKPLAIGETSAAPPAHGAAVPNRPFSTSAPQPAVAHSQLSPLHFTSAWATATAAAAAAAAGPVPCTSPPGLSAAAGTAAAAMATAAGGVAAAPPAAPPPAPPTAALAGAFNRASTSPASLLAASSGRWPAAAAAVAATALPSGNVADAGGGGGGREARAVSAHGGDRFIELAIRMMSLQEEEVDGPNPDGGLGMLADVDVTGLHLPYPPTVPPPPPPPPPPPAGATISEEESDGGRWVPQGAAEAASSLPLPAPLAVPEASLEGDGGGRGGGGGGPSPREQYGMSWQAVRMSAMPMTATATLPPGPTRAPSRLRRQGSVNNFAAAGATATAAAAPTRLRPLPATASGHLPHPVGLTTSRSLGRDGGGFAAAAAKAVSSGGGGGFYGTLRSTSRRAFEGLLLRRPSSPGAVAAPPPALAEPDAVDFDDVVHNRGDGGGGGGGGPAAAAVSSAPLHLASAALRKVASGRGESTAERLLRQTSGERGSGGGGGGLRRYGTSISKPPSPPPLGHYDSGLSEAGPTGGAAVSPSRLPYTSGALSAAVAHEQHLQVRFGGEETDTLDPESNRVPYNKFDPGSDPVSYENHLARQGNDGGVGGGYVSGGGGDSGDCGGGGGGAFYSSGFDADDPTARLRRRAQSEYGAWASTRYDDSYPNPDPDPEPELTLDAVLHVESPEQLESYLQLILDNPSNDLLAVRERVANAVNVFGMEELVMRLFPIVGRPDGGGGGGGGSFRLPQPYGSYGPPAHTASRRGVIRGGRRTLGPTGGAQSQSQSQPQAHHQVGAKPDFHRMIGDEYNAKWRLLSAFIDANCRYLMPLLYVLCFLLIMWAKVWANTELREGPSPEASSAT